MSDFREALAEAVRNALFTTDTIWQYGHPKQLALEERLDRMTASLAPGIIAALPPSILEAIELGMAFAEVTAALPEGWRLGLASEEPWTASAWNLAFVDGYRGGVLIDGEGDTAAAALLALTERLRATK